jgi:hypothetical protein
MLQPKYVLAFCFLLCIASSPATGDTPHSEGSPTSTPAPGRAVAAGNSGACTLDELTNKCEFFKPGAPPIIEVDSGKTFIPNFAAIDLSKELGKQAARRQEKMDALKKDTTSALRDIQWEATELLYKSDPNHVISRYAKQHLVSNLINNAPLFKSPPGRGKIEVMWPMLKPGNVRAVDIQEVHAELKTRVGDETLKHLYDLSQKAKTLLEDTEEEIDAINTAPDEPPTDPVLKRLWTVNPGRVDEVKNLFAFAKKAVIARIIGNTPMSNLSTGQRSALEKVKTVKLDPTPLDALRKDSNCRPGSPNAFYFALSHQVTICPEFYNFPDETILAVLGHELMHPIDPCNSAFPTYEVDRAAIFSKGFESGVPKPEITSSRGKGLVLDALFASGTSGYTAYPFPFEDVSTKDLAYFEKHGMIKKVSDRIERSDYPFADVYDCLTNPKGAAYEGFNAEKAMLTAQRVATLRKEKSPKVDLEKSKKDILKILSKYPDCDATTRHSKVNEGMSDWMGANVVADYLSSTGKKLKTPGERLAPISFFAMYSCIERDEMETSMKNARTDGARLKTVWEHYDLWAKDPHSTSGKRVEDLFISNPEIRSAWGCMDKTEPVCKHPKATTVAWVERYRELAGRFEGKLCALY